MRSSLYGKKSRVNELLVGITKLDLIAWFFLCSKLRISASWQRWNEKSLTKVANGVVVAACCDLRFTCCWSRSVLEVEESRGSRSANANTRFIVIHRAKSSSDIFFCALLTLLCLWMKLTLSSSAVATATKRIATKIDFMALFFNFQCFSLSFVVFSQVFPLITIPVKIKPACFLVNLKFEMKWRFDSIWKQMYFTNTSTGDGAVWKKFRMKTSCATEKQEVDNLQATFFPFSEFWLFQRWELFSKNKSPKKI